MAAFRFRILVSTIGAVALFALAGFPAHAHHGAEAELAAPQPPSDAPLVAATGTVEELVVEDQVSNVTERYIALRFDDGSSVALSGPGLDALPAGARVEAIGRNAGNTLFVISARILAQPQLAAQAAPTLAVEGTLALVHADDFANGRGKYNLVVIEGGGYATPLNVAVIPGTLQVGMHVAASGSQAPDGFSLDAKGITIFALAAPSGVLASPSTNNVLVMAIKFTDSPATDPFTPAQIDQAMRTDPGSVANYYNEVSYGQHLLNITVACLTPSTGCTNNTYTGGWLKGIDPTTKAPIPTPGSCNFGAMGAAADAAATQAGYNPSSYNNRYYVIPSNNSCGWAGLAYIGFPYTAWSNAVNALWVYGHELGHNFTLYHAGSVNCNGQVIASSNCGVAEYGDPFDVMGNINPMHFNAMQKSDLNWIPASSVKTHASGTATYVLSPLESPGKTTYAVKIPATTLRTYWVEFRQPIGFDAAMSGYPNLGAQIRVAAPFETSSGADDTEILDMTPGTANNFHDAALMVGQTYTDSTNGINISVLSATATALTVQVTSAAGATTTMTTSLNPSIVGTTVTFKATVTGTAPTGTVKFSDGSTVLCSGVAFTGGTANARTAQCSTSSLSTGTHGIVAVYGGDANNGGSSSAPLSQVVTAATANSNYALASNGGIATASSTFGAGYPASSIINNERAGANWGSGGGWQDGTPNKFPDWVQIRFSAAKSISRVVVYTQQDNFTAPVEPSDTQTFSLYGITAFTVQGWLNNRWTTLASVSGNNLVKRTVTFAPVTTNKIRISVTKALAPYSRITEVEAWSN